jgi:ribosome maturation factor RimP
MDQNHIKQVIEPILAQHNKQLYKFEQVKEANQKIFRIILTDKEKLDMDINEVATINQEILDLINDDLPDDTYLEVTSRGIEYELENREEEKLAINQYIYVSLYQKEKTTGAKEFYGTLLEVNDASIKIESKIKTRTIQVEIEHTNIAKIRLAVKF